MCHTDWPHKTWEKKVVCKDVCKASLLVLMLCVSGGTFWCSGWKTITHHVPLRIGISNVTDGAVGLGLSFSSRNEIAVLELQPNKGGACGCSYGCPALSMCLNICVQAV